MTTTGHGCTFEHEAFFYGSDDDYVAALVPYLDEGVDAGDSVIAVVPDRQAARLRDALGSPSGEVAFVDAVEWYRHPARTIARYDDLLCDLGGRRARVVGEVQFGATAQDWAGWTRYEAALNRALEHHRARVVCPYDIRRLPEQVVEDARRTHPLLFQAIDRTPNHEYVEPETLVADLAPAVPLPTTPPAVDLTVTNDLGTMRRAFAGVAADARIDPDRVAELTVAVNEVATNALVHGSGTARLRAWIVGLGEIVCAVDDDGPGVHDPLLGFIPVPTDASGGRGIWLARQLFDLAEMAPTESGFRVTLVTATA
jgi:anti-sigma regulatory factor (Ser/Thr protein kinase)